MFEQLQKKRQEQQQKEVLEFLDGVVQELKKKSWSMEIMQGIGNLLSQVIAREVNISEKGKRANEAMKELRDAKFSDLFEEERNEKVRELLK